MFGTEGNSDWSALQRVNQILKVAEAGVVALVCWNVLHGALDEGEQNVFLGTPVLHAEQDKAFVVVTSEVSPEVLHGIERTGSNGKWLQLEVHSNGSGGKVVRLVGATYRLGD